MADTIQFVDDIKSSPTVELDLNDGTTWKILQKPAPDFSPPTLKKVRIATLLRDGAEIPASAWDNRFVRMRARVAAATQDALATELQKLHRILNRKLYIMKYQRSGATNPVFFRCKRSAHWDRVTYEPQAAASIDLEIEAEPFAYGLRVTGSPITVNNDPAAGSNPCYFDVTGVTGDVPTPAFIEIDPPYVSNTDVQTLFAVRRHGTPATPYVWQSEAMTQGADTSVQVTDAVMSGATNNYSRTTFATATMQTRLSTSKTFPAAAGVDIRGTFRLYQRLRRSDNTSVINVRAQIAVAAVNGDPISLDTITTPLTTNRHWLDLGLLTLPVAVSDPITEGYSNTEQDIQPITLALQAERISGAGTLDWDVLLVVPADEELLIVRHLNTASINLICDGPRDKSYRRTTGDIETGAVSMVGNIPLLSPNQTNRFSMLLDVGPGTNNDSITASSSVTVSYWPRFLFIR